MKTKATLFLGLMLLFLGFVTELSAQKFHYGASLGTNFSVQSETGDLYNNDGIKTGLHAGIFGKMSIGKRVSLQTEINYEQKGSVNDGLTNTYSYTTVPVLFKLSLGKSLRTPLSFNVYAGPYAGFLVDATTEIKNAESTQTIDNKGNTYDNEWGVTGGFGLVYPVSGFNLLLDFRLGLGLNSYDKLDNDLRNKYFGINLGIEF